MIPVGAPSDHRFGRKQATEMINGCCGFATADGRRCRGVVGKLWDMSMPSRDVNTSTPWCIVWAIEGAESVVVYVPRHFRPFLEASPPTVLVGRCPKQGHGDRYGDPQDFLDAAAKPTVRNQVGIIMMDDHPPPPRSEPLRWQPTIQ